MEVNKRQWPILSVCSIKARIDTNPDFQRPAVWSTAQKQLLIDTILRGYDIPKFYWSKTSKSPESYAVVDGQQRLRAIFDFIGERIGLPRDADPIEGIPVAAMKYSQLPEDLRLRFETYTLDVVVLSDTGEEEVREMFLRLQNGTSLKAQEKRNAMPGNMRGFVKNLVEHEFFARCNFSNSRFTHDHVAAQMTLLELNGGPCNVKNANLNAMYAEHIGFDTSSKKARKVKRVLDYLARAFPEKAPELERFSVLSLFGLVSHCLERYAFGDSELALREWFIGFERERAAQLQLSGDEMSPELVQYREHTSHSTDSEASLEWRQGFLLQRFLQALPTLELKDQQRLFSPEQRKAIFRRDQGMCQLRLRCTGARCDWDAWEADHRVAWSHGGKTTVENGQVACSACNAAKGAGD
jgi:hypothetical protein